MADEMVRAAQRFINSYNVSGIPKVEENGVTSWTVMRALTRVLQYHLGISALSDSFGPTTLAKLEANYPVIDSQCLVAGINRVVQSALWCKGYAAGEIDGVYDGEVSNSVEAVASDAGLSGSWADGAVRPKLFKALLTMDAYVTVSGGTDQVRSVQQWLNRNYLDRRDFYIIPCDGNFSRDVQKALLLAIQFAIGMSDDVANGTFGPGTKDGLQEHPVRVGDTGTWVRLFTAALVFNERAGATFSGTFTSNHSSVVRTFQNFVKLPVNGVGNFKTWASLLISYGDETRVGTAADTSTELTKARLNVLRDAGYEAVGRYLCNFPGSSFNKMIQPGELDRCANNGMRVFPIYQMDGGSSSSFNRRSGTFDGFNAIEWAKSHGFKAGTTIYFAVDYDALDDDVTNYIIPYFQGVNEVIRQYATGYNVGVYGARNVCSRVSSLVLAEHSFISDMSSGFSGNLGYPHPTNWAFDQISTVSYGAGTSGLIIIDNNIASGRDSGQISFNPRPVAFGNDVAFDLSYRDTVLSDLRQYLATLGYGETGTPSAIGHPTYYSTAEALDIVLSKDVDPLVTQQARRLSMRKALAQAVLFEEIRHVYQQDDFTDAEVKAYYNGFPSTRNDCSTGMGQIFARTAILARNFCINSNIIDGSTRNPNSESDLWAIWQKLYGQSDYNVTTVPLVLIFAASGPGQAGVGRPGLDQNWAEAKKTLTYYNGAASYGERAVGYWQIFEKYNAVFRSRT